MRYFIGLSVLVSCLLGCGGGGGNGGTGDNSGVGTSAVEGYVYSRAGQRAIALQGVSPRPLGEGQIPVVGAIIKVAGMNRSTTTDTSGYFHLEGIAAGRHNVTITHEAFRDPCTVSVTTRDSETSAVAAELGVGQFIMVGVGDYINLPTEFDLTGPPNDARGMAQLLFESFAGEGTLLLDSAATKAGIKAAITHAAEGMGKDDFLVFFFSGHGGLTETGSDWVEYICPADTEISNLNNDISDSELRDWLANVPNPKRCIVIIDSCYSGAFFDGHVSPGTRVKVRPFTGEVVARSLSKLGCTVLASSASYELSAETDGYGVFTRYLIDGLDRGRQAADTNHDHTVTAKELFEYAKPRATQLYPMQHPQIQVGPNPVMLRY